LLLLPGLGGGRGVSAEAAERTVFGHVAVATTTKTSQQREEKSRDKHVHATVAMETMVVSTCTIEKLADRTYLE
jgi:hypothetical protein